MRGFIAVGGHVCFLGIGSERFQEVYLTGGGGEQLGEIHCH